MLVTHIAKILRLKLIRCRSNTKVSDRYLIDINLRAFAIWEVMTDCRLNIDIFMILGTWRVEMNGSDFKRCQGTTDPDSKVHGANMGPIWDLSAPDGPHVGPMDLAIRGWSCVWVKMTCSVPIKRKPSVVVMGVMATKQLFHLLQGWPHKGTSAMLVIGCDSHYPQFTSEAVSVTVASSSYFTWAFSAQMKSIHWHASSIDIAILYHSFSVLQTQIFS